MHLQQYFEDDELKVELQVPIIADFNIIAGVKGKCGKMCSVLT